MDPVVMISIALLLDKRKRKKKKFWTKQWFQQKQNFGHVMLLNELRINHPEDYRIFLCMDEESFDELMEMLTPLIQKKDTCSIKRRVLAHFRNHAIRFMRRAKLCVPRATPSFRNYEIWKSPSDAIISKY